MPAPYSLRLAVYNAAGERVRTLFDGAARGLPERLHVGADVFTPGEAGLQIRFPVQLVDAQGRPSDLIAWRGDNDNGQLVQGGYYVLKAEFSDVWGNITTLQYGVQATAPAPADSLAVYNAAGELVAVLPLDAWGRGRFSGLSVDGDGVGLKFSLRAEGGAVVQAFWDGRNSRGERVSPGAYIVQLIHRGSEGAAVVESRVFSLLGDAVGSLESAVAGPNPSGGAWNVIWQPYPGGRISADAYNQAGERVCGASADSAAGRLDLDCGTLASGVYLLVLRDALLGRLAHSRFLKLAVVR